jgi:DNA-binding MarR family transcriptional regulator
MTLSKKTRAREEPVRAIWLFKRVFHQGHRAVNDAVRRHGVTATQMGALNRLIAEPGLSGAELARRLLVSPQAAQLAVVALEKRGFVERIPDANHGRIVRTYLTEAGRQVAAICMVRGLEAEEAFLAVLSAEERRTLVDLLLRLVMQEPPTA